MTKLFLPFLFLFGINLSINAQSDLEKAANYAADYICDCVNKVYSDIDSDVRDVILKMTALSTDEQTDYIFGLSEDLQARLLEQSLAMSDESKSAEFDECNTKLSSEIERKFSHVENDPNFSEEKMMKMMLDHLSKGKRCEFTYLLMKIGLEQPQNDDDYIIEDDNSEGGEEGQ